MYIEQSCIDTGKKACTHAVKHTPHDARGLLCPAKVWSACLNRTLLPSRCGSGIAWCRRCCARMTPADPSTFSFGGSFRPVARAVGMAIPARPGPPAMWTPAAMCAMAAVGCMGACRRVHGQRRASGASGQRLVGAGRAPMIDPTTDPAVLLADLALLGHRCTEETQTTLSITSVVIEY